MNATGLSKLSESARASASRRIAGWTIGEKLANVGTSVVALCHAKRASGLRSWEWRDSMRQRVGQEFAREAALRSGGETLVEEGLLLARACPVAARWRPSDENRSAAAGVPMGIPKAEAAVPPVVITEADLAEIQALASDPKAMAELNKTVAAIGQVKPQQSAARPSQPARQLTGRERLVAAIDAQLNKKNDSKP